MTTLRDALSDALGQADEGTLTTPVETPIETPDPISAPTETAEQVEARQRDERGRFAPKANEPAKVTAQPQVALEPRKPPSSWKKDYWGHWEKIGSNPELAPLQDYIEQREAEYSKGVSTYKGQWDQAQPIYEAIQPFAQDLQKAGIQPAQWITNLGNAHKTLALGNPQQKLQMFAKLAADYGIPLQALNNGQIDPQQSHVLETVSTLQRELESIKNERVQSEQTQLAQQIEAFKKDAPYFEEVKHTMAGLLQSQLAPDLKTAYEKAIRMDDTIWQKEQARQAEISTRQRQQQIAGKKAAAVSPRSSSPTGAVGAGNAKKGLRDHLSESFDSVSTERF